MYTLLVSRSEYPRDKPFLLTIVSYLKKRKEKKKIPRALSELPANWPGLTQWSRYVGEVLTK